jgi:hypothetical protein
MPTAQDLDTLHALLAQLQTVSSFQPGELIRAADWNTLAGAVAQLAQLVLAAESAATVPPHQHLDQVDLTWFTNQVSDLLQRGPLSDPAAQNRLTALEQTQTRLQSRLDTATSTISDLRSRVTDVATNDLVRQTAITTVQRTLTAVADPGPQIAAMRASLDSVQSSLATVQQAASSLVVGGKPIDVGALAGRLTNLEQFRDSLKSANGQLLDGATLDQRFSQLQTTAVTQDQLTQAFKDHPVEIPADQVNALETRLGTTLHDQVNTQLQTFQTQVQSNVDTRLSSVGDLVNSRISDAVPGLTQTLTSNLSTSIAAAQKAATDAANASAQAAIAAREQAIRADLGTQISNVNASLTAAVNAQVTQQLGVSLQSIQSSLAAASQKLDAVSATVAQQGATLQDHATQLASVPQTLASLKNDLQQSIINQVNLQVATINRNISDQFAAFQKTQSDQLSVATQNILTQASSAATQAATTAATNAANTMRAQITADMQSIAQQQATAIMNAQVKSAVTIAVNAQFAAVPGMVASEVQRVNSSQVQVNRNAVNVIK